jgi:hypothetical protein
MSQLIASLFAKLGIQDELTPGLKKGRVALGDFAGGMKDSLSGLLGFTSAAAAGALVISTFAKAVGEAAREESNLVSMGATIQSMGLSADVSAVGIRAMTESMQAANGVFAHDDLEKAAQSFLKIEGFDISKLRDTLGVVQDFAAGTGQGVASAGDAIARALETGQVRSLGFSAALRTQIQTMITAGDRAGALSLIMDTLNSKYGGQAAAQMDTYNGKLSILTNNWNEFLAVLGGEGLESGKGILSELNNIVLALIKFSEWANLGAMNTNYFSSAVDGAAESASLYARTNYDLDYSLQAVSGSTEDLLTISKGWQELMSGTTPSLESMGAAAFDAALAADGLYDSMDAASSTRLREELGLITEEEAKAMVMAINFKAALDALAGMHVTVTVDMIGSLIQGISGGMDPTELAAYLGRGGQLLDGGGERVWVRAGVAGSGPYPNAPVWRNTQTGAISKTDPGFAAGGSFVVPSGYPNDSFGMRVQSGEKVSVTPATSSSPGETTLSRQSINELKDALMYAVAPLL